MFSFVVDAVAAANQAGLFLGALFCLGIGGLILGNSLYWRLHALRVTGTVIGVVDKGGTYTPVYRYTTPDGQTREARSDTSSSMSRGKETGRVVRLLISPHDPGAASEASSHPIDIIGLLLIAPGVLLAYVALTAYPVTWMTWIMAAVLLVYLVVHGRRLVIPKGQRGSREEWRRAHGAGPLDPASVKPIERILATPEAHEHAQAQARSNRKAAPLVGLFAAALLAAGLYVANDVARLEASGLRAQGAVVRLKAESSSGSSGYSYHPIVRFRTDRNVTIEFKDSVGSNPPGYRPGDKVTVLYLPDDPRGHAIIDRGPLWNWAIPVLLLLGAGLLGWLAWWVRRSGANATPSAGLAAQVQG
jgi:hypothetical protein